MPETQWKRKKSYYIYLEDRPDEIYGEIISDLVKQCAFANIAYQKAKGMTNSTIHFQIMFGDALQERAPWWKILTNDILTSTYKKQSGKCSKCGIDANLELIIMYDSFEIVCKHCNPNPSKYVNISDSSIPYEVRKLVWHRDGGKCHVDGCRAEKDNLQYDHIIPRSFGGSNTEYNLVLKCRSHNLRKSNKLVFYC